jgi:thymidylate synthase ThyX
VPDRRIYVLSPKELSPETIAVAFAKTSRSPETFDAIAAGLTDEKSAQFHEKWVVGYGHASVAEHAVLHVAFENVSRLAIECLESNRLASYTEKSTRYQKWTPDDFHSPAELRDHALLDEFTRVCRLLFGTYRDSLDPVRDVVVRRTARRENESAEALDRRVRSQYVDVCRFLLPAAALANVGMTANARVLENALRKLLSHELQEVREIGEQLKVVALVEIPTLVKYAEPCLSGETGRRLALRVFLVPKRPRRRSRGARRVFWWTLTPTVRTLCWRLPSIATGNFPSHAGWRRSRRFRRRRVSGLQKTCSGSCSCMMCLFASWSTVPTRLI